MLNGDMRHAEWIGIASMVGGCGLLLDGDPVRDAGIDADIVDADAKLDRSLDALPDRAPPDAEPPTVCTTSMEGIECRPGENAPALDHRCHDGLCAAVECDSDADCFQTECLAFVCEDFFCVARPALDGRDCDAFSERDGECRSGTCVPNNCPDGDLDEGELCDDGNSGGGDGCEIDCTPTCTSSCDDGLACNGFERCVPVTRGGAGSLCQVLPFECASDACSVCVERDGTCAPVPRDEDGDGFAGGAGCADCDDADPTANPAAPEIVGNPTDEDCDGAIDETRGEPVPWLPDLDLDGYGDDRATATRFFEPPGAGWAIAGGDCYDSATDPNAAAVHPRQTMFFETPYVGPDGESFDYNCDDRDEKRTNALLRCALILSRCSGNGWDDVVPECGASGRFVSCRDVHLLLDLVCRESSAIDLVQACR